MVFGCCVVTLASHVALPASPNSHEFIGFHPLLSGSQVQRCHPDSFLNWMERSIRLRKECPEFGWGAWQILDTNHPSVIAHCCEWQGGVVIAVHNLAASDCTVTLMLKDSDGKGLIDLFEDQSDEVIVGDSHVVHVKGYGYRWFRLCNKSC